MLQIFLFIWLCIYKAYRPYVLVETGANEEKEIKLLIVKGCGNILFPGLFSSVTNKQKKECGEFGGWLQRPTSPMLQDCVPLLWGKNVPTLMSHLKKKSEEATGRVWSHIFWPDVLALTGVSGQMDDVRKISKSKRSVWFCACSEVSLRNVY